MRPSNQDEGDDILKNAFENQSLPPLPDLWPNIDSALDQIDSADSVKNAFQAQTIPPLPDLWPNIDSTLDQIDSADSVKNAFQAQTIPALPDLWDNISEHLPTANELPPYNAISNAFHDHFLTQANQPSHQKNIEKAWNNIQPQLPRAKSNYRRVAALAILLLLLRQCGDLVQIAPNTHPNNSQNNSFLAQFHPATNGEPKNTLNTPSKNNVKAVLKPIFNHSNPLAHDANSTHKRNHFKPKKQTQNNIQTPTNKNDNAPKQNLANTIENTTTNPQPNPTNLLLIVPNSPHNEPKYTREGRTLPSHANMLFDQFNTPSPEASEISKKSPDKADDDANFNRFQLGVGSEITTALLWNQESQEALSQKSSSSLNFLPKLNLFVQLKFQIDPHHALAFNLHPNSVSQQQFGEFSTSGIYLRKETKLQYTRYSAQYQYQWHADDLSRPLFGSPFAAASIQFGHLIRSQETINDLPQTTTFKKNQYNLGIGIGYQIRYQRLLLSCGLHTSLSLHNIAHGSQTSLFQVAPFAMLHYGF